MLDKLGGPPLVREIFMRHVFPILAGLWSLTVLGKGTIVINEIHYDPEPKHEFVEFIELFNAGEETVSLEGWRLSEGVFYTFPAGSELAPGAYLVLAQNAEAYNAKFASIFVGGLKAFDSWDRGYLSNEGETITLEDAGGTMIDEVDYRVGFPWPVAPNDETGLSMELLHPSLDNELGSSWRSALERPTPGRRNSVFSEQNPPNIRQVRHEPKSPKSSQGVVITAKVTDPQGVATVTLGYQAVAPGDYVPLTASEYEENWETLAMRDDGDGADETAGDAVFTAGVPASVQRHRWLIRYRITVEDGEGTSVRAPFADDPQPNFAYFCYDGVPPWTGTDRPGETPPKVYGEDVLTSLPIYHLITREEDVLACQYNSAHNNKVYRFLGTLVYDGEVYDHMRYRIRGHGSTYNTGKNKWKWRFNRGNLFEARDDFGRPYREPLRTLNISGMASPWNPANRGMCGLDEALAFRLWRMAGVPACHTHYFHFRIIDDVVETSTNDQYEGDLWGPYLAIEQFDGRFLEERDLPDGNAYNMHFENSNYLNSAPGQPTDRSDLTAFVGSNGYNKTNPIQPVSWWRENVELDWYYSYRCVWEAVNHSDQRDRENSIYYHNPQTEKWSIHPWDVDLLYEEFDRWGPDAVQSTVPFEQFRKCLQHEELNAEFQNRARELQDLLLNEDQLGWLIDEVAGFVGTKGDSSTGIEIIDIHRDGARTIITTASPHGLSEGDTAYLQGLLPSDYSGSHQVVAILSPTHFAYRSSIFAPPPEDPLPSSSVTDKASGGSWWEIDRDRWNHHPRSRAIEGPSTNTGSFYVNPFPYTRFPGKIRTLVSADFPGMVQWVKDFTAPPGFGGALLKALAESPRAPDTPSIAYTGPAGFPADQLSFESGPFSGGSLFQPQEFVAMKWRLGEIRNPTTPNHVPGEPMLFEIDPIWESEVLTSYVPEMQLPVNAIRPGHTYRVRVRMENQLGHWSHWSEPVEFVAGEPEVGGFRENLVITEVMYHPAPLTEEESAAGFEEADFEFIELHHRGTGVVDLTNLRFTKGIDFDFPQSTVLAPGGYLVVARNAEAFMLRYGGDIEVAGSWGEAGGKLDNAGERVKLSFGAGVPIIDFDYDDEDGWPGEADGEGRSLVLVPGGDPGDPGSWAASSQLGGSPGRENPEMLGRTLMLIGYRFEESPPTLTLRWQSVAGRQYVIQEASDLREWSSVTESIEAVDAATEFTLNVIGTRYYRVAEQ